MEPLEVVVDGGIDDAVALAVLLGAGVPIRQVHRRGPKLEHRDAT